MTTRTDGGDQPAFPAPFQGHCGNDSHADPCGCYLDKGITIRDYFAAAALPAVVAGCVELALLGQLHDHNAQAKAAYLLADAMLRIRSEERGKVT